MGLISEVYISSFMLLYFIVEVFCFVKKVWTVELSNLLKHRFIPFPEIHNQGSYRPLEIPHIQQPLLHKWSQPLKEQGDSPQRHRILRLIVAIWKQLKILIEVIPTKAHESHVLFLEVRVVHALVPYVVV